MRELNVNEIQEVNGGNPVVGAVAAVVLSPVAGAVAAGVVTAVAAYATYKAVKSLF